MTITKQKWAIHNNREVLLYTLDNGSIQVTFTNFGCTLTAILIDVNGTMRNVVLSYNSPEEYFNDPYYLNCIVGRFANRIDGAIFTLDGQQYELSRNEPDLDNHVHGGVQGFGKKVFEIVEEKSGSEKVSVTLRYVSPHGEEGYPGTVTLSVTFELCISGEFTIRYAATTDRPTHLNLTHHTYFNLGGSGNDISDHSLCINADSYLEVNERFLPTGKILNVGNTRFDFRKVRKVFSSSSSEHMPVFNTYFLFDQDSKFIQAVLTNNRGEVSLGVSTSLPGLLLYTGDYLGAPFRKFAGLCLECQYPPDAPNQPHLPETVLRPGNRFDHYIKYQFSNREG